MPGRQGGHRVHEFAGHIRGRGRVQDSGLGRRIGGNGDGGHETPCIRCRHESGQEVFSHPRGNPVRHATRKPWDQAFPDLDAAKPPRAAEDAAGPLPPLIMLLTPYAGKTGARGFGRSAGSTGAHGAAVLSLSPYGVDKGGALR
ncbi:hypothetical protein GCM10012284_53140 [Mangrovihabitans endophyticus]|uniref:Uncharacterized protein n=1 Tax=Mangrovihabitans endophyticus TaxID=1751298 RepID=A0A8J3C5C6_9ACTN|nr:hypothetical protein GCM10012284_53140 [Mangrovihabitans endophyticus]